jgi:DNA polymerase III sliding clamp (beta) subunit (PCNA family)
VRIAVLPESFKTQLARCSKITTDGGKTGLRPIYSYVLISGLENSLIQLRVRDPHVLFEGRLVAETITKTGEALVECDRLVNVMKTRIEGHAVDMWTDEEFLHIKQGEFRAKLPLLRKETIPAEPFDPPTQFSIDLEPKMLDAINRCGGILEGDRGDDPFQGLLIDLEEPGMMRILGMSRALINMAQFGIPVPGGFRVVMAPRALALFATLAGNEQLHLAIDTQNAKVLLTSPEVSMRISCLEDNYPRKYVPYLGLHELTEGRFWATQLDKDGNITGQTPKYVFRLHRAPFLDALTSASSVLGKEDQAIEFNANSKLANGSTVVEIVGLNRFTKAKASEKILAESDLQSAFQIGLNYAKVRECLRIYEADVFRMYVAGASDPVVLVEEGATTFVSLTMPMKVA